MTRRRQPTWRPDGDAYMKTEFLSSLAAPRECSARSKPSECRVCMVVWSKLCIVLFTFKRTELH